MASVIQVTTVNYPESDGKPMGETDVHIKETMRLRQILERFYTGHSVYVSGNLLVYYEQGNPRQFVVPDVFVVKGIQPGDRRIYKIWFEGKPPDAIIEVTSRKTKKTDMVTKPALYARLGVPEYFLFDPIEEYLAPALQGHRLTGGHYERIAPDAHGALVSEELGLRLHAEGGHVMLYRLDTGERLRTDAEAWQAAEEARQAEAEACRAAEAEVARLRDELRRRDTP
jgi:Uma2 family endonuclease